MQKLIILNKTQNKELFQPKKYNKFITITKVFSFKRRQILRDRWKRSIYTLQRMGQKGKLKKNWNWIKICKSFLFCRIWTITQMHPIPDFLSEIPPSRPQIKVKVHGRVHCHSAWYTFRTFLRWIFYVLYFCVPFNIIYFQF